MKDPDNGWIHFEIESPVRIHVRVDTAFTVQHHDRMFVYHDVKGKLFVRAVQLGELFAPPDLMPRDDFVRKTLGLEKCNPKALSDLNYVRHLIEGKRPRDKSREIGGLVPRGRGRAG